MKRITRDWSATLTIMGLGILLSLIVLAKFYDSGIFELFLAVILAMIIIISFFKGSYNSYVLVDIENKFIDIPIMFNLKRLVIESNKIESLSSQEDSKTEYDETLKKDIKTITYKLTLYGNFGNKTVYFSSYELRQEVISNLNQIGL